MGFCMAALGWSARQFMDSTNHEIFAAYEGWRLINCPKED
jgi:hypothetical protein